MKSFVTKLTADFDLSTLTDQKRDNLSPAIVKATPTSTLIQGTPALMASATAVATKSTAFKAARTTAAGSRMVADNDEATAQTARQTIDAELSTFVGIALNSGKTIADIIGAGLTEPAAPAGPPPFAPPDTLDVTFFKKMKGKVRVSPHGTDARTWVVQVSTDATNPTNWIEVYGTGKSRTLTGASGASIWVRYAMVRKGELSAWSIAFHVTFP